MEWRVILAAVAVVCLTALVALHDVNSDVAIPVLTGLISGAAGIAGGRNSGYVQAVKNGVAGAAKGPPS